jgi:trk system potassium uptake protein TrkH
MRFKVIIDGLGLVLMGMSFAYILPILAGLYYHEDNWIMFRAYGIPFLVSLLGGAGLRYIMKGQYEQLRTGEAMVLVAVAWMMLAVIGTIPYMAILGISWIDSFFESMSGFTTTGSTILGGEGLVLDYMDKSILLWRSLTEWLGGMGVIVLSVAILSRFFGGRANPLLMQAEVPGGKVTRMAPRMAQTARLLWGIYALFTAVEAGLLMALGMGAFDAINHAFTTMPTGGFGTHNLSVAYWHNPAIEMVIMVFTLLSGTSFVLHYHALRGKWRMYLRDSEFRFAMLVIGFAIVFITGDLAVRGIYSMGNSMRFASFQVVSIVTTTGYATADFSYWPVSSQLMLVMLMFFGGTLGSTGGGIKMLRMLIVLKSIRLLFYKATHRRGVFHVRLGNVTIADEQVASTAAYVILYVTIAAVAALAIALLGSGDGPIDLVTGVSAVVTAISNVGPGIGAVGPMLNFAALPAVSKFILAILMWLGRLEILGCLLLFSPRALRD